MNRVCWIVLVLFVFPDFGQAQSNYQATCTRTVPSISLLLNDGHEQIETSLHKFIESLKAKEKRFESKIDFARYVFARTHRKFLDHYSRYTEFDRIFEARQYNCLTGTALYAYLYYHLGFEVTLFETRYHSLVKIECHDGVALIESTNPYEGFIAGHDKANAAVQDCLKRESSIAIDGLAIPVNRYPSIKRIDFKQLAGLQYFNAGVVAFNEGHYGDALLPLQDAAGLYPESERIADLIILTKALIDNDLSKVKYLNSKQISDNQTVSYP